MRSRALSIAIALVSSAMPAVVMAADCPSEVKNARQLLAAKTATAKQTTTVARSQAGARGQDQQAPRQQDIQAPRQQDQQAPRQQEIQAPRQQDIQAPRQQEIQAPRQQDQQAPRSAAKGRKTALTNASRLVDEAEAACRDADMPRAASNARAAIDLLSYLP
jgi:hypothetical protein